MYFSHYISASPARVGLGPVTAAAAATTTAAAGTAANASFCQAAKSQPRGKISRQFIWEKHIDNLKKPSSQAAGAPGPSSSAVEASPSQPDTVVGNNGTTTVVAQGIVVL